MELVVIGVGAVMVGVGVVELVVVGVGVVELVVVGVVELVVVGVGVVELVVVGVGVVELVVVGVGIPQVLLVHLFITSAAPASYFTFAGSTGRQVTWEFLNPLLYMPISTCRPGTSGIKASGRQVSILLVRSRFCRAVRSEKMPLGSDVIWLLER